MAGLLVLRRLLRATLVVTTLTSATDVLAAGIGPGNPSPTADTEMGFIVFQQKCTGCHGNGAVERAPTPAQLRGMSPERILTALTTGVMKQVGDTLTENERLRVAASVAGRPLGSDQVLEARQMPNRCTRNPPIRSLDAQPRWNGWGIDAVNSRVQPTAQAGIDAASVARLKLLWAFGLPGASSSYSQPTVVDGHLFVGADTGAVYALDAATGCVHWSFKAKAGVRNAPVLGPRSRGSKRHAVYFGDLLANVYALDADTGRLLWTRNVGQHYSQRVTAAPALHEGRLYVPISMWEGIAAATADYPCCKAIGAVVALDAYTGKLRWRAQSIPGVPQQVGTNAAGTPRFGPAGAPVWNTPTVDAKRRRVYFGSGDASTFPAAPTSDAVIAVDMDSGRTLWSRQVFRNDSFLVGCPVNEPVNNCPQVQGPDWDIPASVVLRDVGGREQLIVSTKPGDILALDPDRDGEVLWRHNLTGKVQGDSPAGSTTGRAARASGVLWGGAIGEQASYFGLTGGGVAAVRTADGQRLWLSPLVEPGASISHGAATTATPDLVFVGGTDGKLSALSARDGSLLWQYDTRQDFQAVNGVPTRGGSISSGGAVIVGGRVYVGSGYGVLGGTTGNAVLAFGLD